MKTKLLIVLMSFQFLGMAQKNKGDSSVEVKTGISLSDITRDTKPILGYNFNVTYSYGLIKNMDLIASMSSYDAFSTEDNLTFVQQMYFSNALQLGVRGKIRCSNVVSLKLSLSGGMMIYAYNNIFKVMPVSEMLIEPCISGMAEIYFNINERMALGVFYGKTIICSSYSTYPYFDSTGISLSLKL